VARPNVGRVYSRSADAVIRVYDAAGNVIKTHEHKGDFRRFEAGPQFPSSAHMASDETGSRWGVTTCKIRKFMLDLSLFSYYTRI
jgi:hypothetical protein